jgi:gamma-glutamyltranspeptidase/glutathione hydrolase
MTRTTTGRNGGRPMIMGTTGVVSAGHYLASEAALAILRRGGNAFDASAAAGFAMTVLIPHQNGFAGEVPMLIYSADDNKTWSLSGQGPAPQAATIDKFTELGLDIIPGDGLLPAVVPSVVASWILLLRRYGTLRLADVMAPAIALAENGFAMYDGLHKTLGDYAEIFKRDWPSSAATYLPNGQAPAIASLWRQTDLAKTLRRLVRSEKRYRKRDAGLQAAYDEFYCGPIAEKMVRFCKTSVPDCSGSSHTGLLTMEDFAGYEARLEEPVATSYRKFRVFKCNTWTQGPAMLQTLNLLEGFDLGAMKHNSTDYIHTVTECMKLAYADREFYYGDPDFSRIPLRRLLSKQYADRRRELVDPARASLELRPGGRAAITTQDVRDVERSFAKCPQPQWGDTTSVQVVDRAGNIVSAVQSGGWLMASPAIPGLGCPLGTRGQMFSLVPGHPNCLEPGKRPRTTLTPTLVGDNRRAPNLAFGCPGGDSQDQWTLQFFLNVVEFGMSYQQAVEAPTFWTGHFPGSFYPRVAKHGSLYIESRITRRIRDELAKRKHKIFCELPFAGGNTMAVGINRKTGVLSAAASPRYDAAYAMGL